MQLEDYISGTVSIANGSTALTGTGTAWKTAALKAGDIFYKAGYAILIASVEDEDAITLADAWPGTTLSDAAYAIRFAPDNSRVQGTTRQLLDQWRQGIYVTPDAVGTFAGRDAHDGEAEGFKYLADDSDPWVLYAKLSNTSGDWSTGTSWGGPQGDQGLPGSSDVVGTSATSLAIATGSKTFTVVEADRGWGIGARLRASSDADAANFMEGIVTAYAANSLTLAVDLVGGSGTKADWTINLAGEPGGDADIAADTHAATGKTTPVDADELPLADSAATFGLKKLTWANVKATLKTYLDTLYLAKTVSRREVLTAARTYYVATTGSDSNDGLSSGTAFATIQKAVDTVCAIDPAAYQVTISIGAGTFNETVTLRKHLASLAPLIVGAGIGSTFVKCFTGLDTFQGSTWRLTSLTLNGTSVRLLYFTGIGALSIGAVEFAGTTPTQNARVENGFVLSTEGSISIGAGSSGGGGGMFDAIQGAIINWPGTTFNLTANITFNQFLSARDGGIFEIWSCTFNLNGFTATGTRYLANALGLIQTGGGGATYLPGSVDGSTPATGGQYV